MKEFLAIFNALPSTIPAALVTLVKVEGSSYRRAGARLLWSSKGTRIGTISGGCLEEDVLLHCRETLDTGNPRKIIYDTTKENEDVWGVGLGCNGIVHLLIERITQIPLALQRVHEAWAEREAVVLATVFTVAGDYPLGPMLASKSAGGGPWREGPAEWFADFSREAARASKEQRSFTAIFPHLPGSPEVFFEYLPPPISLVICGAGDDAQPLVRLATELGWHVTITDPRAAYATKERFFSAKEVIVASASDAVERLTFDERTAAVVMTHHYVHDLPFLRGLLPKTKFYLGLLGPKKRTERLLAELEKEGNTLTVEKRARIHGPVGLDLGANTPEEVALSVLAEIQAVLHGRDARPLRDRVRPIHD